MYLASDCSDPVGVGGDPRSLPRGCSPQDAGPDGDDGCATGECVHVHSGWFGPTWLWSGPEAQAPDCPSEIYYEGYDDFVPTAACEVCTCQPPTGSCALSSQLTESTTACNIPGGSSASFDAPPGWDGTCDSSTQVPSGVAHSLTIAPMAMMENGCVPGPPVPAKVIPVQGAKLGRACHGRGWSVCGDITSSVCIPRDDPPPPGFRLCIFREGDNNCPPMGGFTEKNVFYDQAEEGCVDCGCGPPVGSACTAMLSVYNAGMCAGPPVEQVSLGSAAPTCVDIVPSGQALGSKSAGPATYLPGMCPPTGGQTNALITRINPSTLCCRP